MPDCELLDLIEAAERMSRWSVGLRTRLIAAYADRHPRGSSAPPPGATIASPVTRWLPDELGMALRLPRLHAQGLIAEAQRLAHVLTHARTGAGRDHSSTETPGHPRRAAGHGTRLPSRARRFGRIGHDRERPGLALSVGR